MEDVVQNQASIEVVVPEAAINLVQDVANLSPDDVVRMDRVSAYTVTLHGWMTECHNQGLLVRYISPDGKRGFEVRYEPRKNGGWEQRWSEFIID